MTEPTIRRATAAEVPLIAAMTREAYARWVPIAGREPLPMTVDYESAFAAHRFDLLVEDGEVAGLIETVAEDDGLLVVNVAVRPASQGRGHGHRLLAHAEALARDAGLAVMRLYTNALFVENIALYRGLGYAVVREERAPRGLIAHMEKRLGEA